MSVSAPTTDSGIFTPEQWRDGLLKELGKLSQ